MADNEIPIPFVVRCAPQILALTTRLQEDGDVGRYDVFCEAKIRGKSDVEANQLVQEFDRDWSEMTRRALDQACRNLMRWGDIEGRSMP